jgi:hypothetical protein
VVHIGHVRVVVRWQCGELGLPHDGIGGKAGNQDQA